MLSLLMLRNCQTIAFNGEHKRLKLSVSVLHAEKTSTSGSHWADSTPVRLTSSWITGLSPPLPTFFPAKVSPKLINYRITPTMELRIPACLILIIIAQYTDKAISYKYKFQNILATSNFHQMVTMQLCYIFPTDIKRACLTTCHDQAKFAITNACCQYFN